MRMSKSRIFGAAAAAASARPPSISYRRTGGPRRGIPRGREASPGSCSFAAALRTTAHAALFRARVPSPRLLGHGRASLRRRARPIGGVHFCTDRAAAINRTDVRAQSPGPVRPRAARGRRRANGRRRRAARPVARRPRAAPPTAAARFAASARSAKRLGRHLPPARLRGEALEPARNFLRTHRRRADGASGVHTPPPTPPSPTPSAPWAPSPLGAPPSSSLSLTLTVPRVVLLRR